PVVTGPNAVVPHHLQVLEEGADELRVEVREVEIRGALAVPLGREAQQEAEGVAIRGEGVRARPSLDHQPVHQERLQCRGQGAHRSPPPGRLSRRAAMSSMSSGETDRYQK